MATADGRTEHRVVLDGRAVRTPAKRFVAVPTEALALALAEEWSSQGERIDPVLMPLTRLTNSSIDAVADAPKAVVDDIVAFAGSDLLCYRAESPDELVARQRARWDPILAWAARDLGAKLVAAAGVMPREQPAESLAKIARALTCLDTFQLTGLHVLTTLTGSALLALAHARGRLSAEEAWQAAHVDEDWQIELWGVDAEAEARRAFRWAEFQAASRLLDLVAMAS
jgi:chaperone required for assembly of F1-ATPase